MVALLCLECGTLRAQWFEWGVRDGANISSLVGIDNTTPLGGLYVGVATSFLFDERWGASLDATLSSQGTRCLENADGVSTTYNYEYLNIPLMATYRIGLKDGSEVRFMAGPQLGLFLVGSVDYTAPSVLDGGYVQGSTMLDSEDFHPMDFGISVGLQWLLGEQNKTAIELRYTHGITQTHDGISNTLNGYYYISVPNNRNSVFQIGTVFYF